MNKSGYFFTFLKKALPNTILFQKGKQAIGGKNLKKSLLQLHSLLVLLEKKRWNNCYLEEPKSSVFQGLKNTSRPANVYYFGNSKSWMIHSLKLCFYLTLIEKQKGSSLPWQCCTSSKILNNKFSNINAVFLKRKYFWASVERGWNYLKH